MQSLQHFADYQVDFWWNKAKEIFGNIGEKPKCVLNNRLKSTGGRAFIEHGYIDLSVSLLRDNMDYYAKDTIPHELAHMIAFRLYQDRGHGKAWKYVAQTLYGANNRCHTMQIKRKG